MHCQLLDQQVSSTWVAQAANLNALTDEPRWSEAQLVAACHGDDLVIAAIEEECLVGYLVIAAVLDEAEIHTVLVDQGRRGKGIAKAMFSAAKFELDQQGVKQVFLEVRESNMAARGLYEGFGFKVIGERKGYYKNTDGSRETALLMQLLM